MSKKRVIAYLHTHWDREWYREFEIFRMRLLRVFDEILEALEDGLIPSFYFDGQVVALLDYLKIRPEKEALVRRFIEDKRLFIGPFYCLIDEFLTSEKLFRKNLEIGLKIARDYGCKNFIGYLPDTFGHSDGVIKILKDFGLEEAVVWRGCGDLPSEFIWGDSAGNKINAINLLRGYFMDIFTSNLSIESKAKFLKENLNKIAECSGEVLLLPIGADHLGVPKDIKSQIAQVNEILQDYSIELGSIYDYIDAVKGNHKEVFEGELRDNSKTFTLEGSYSSRADLKRLNIISTHKLMRAERLVEYYSKNEKYSNLLEYAYKLLLKNQAHDSICGCSTDDTHQENIIRYKKIQQVADNIVAEIRFEQGLYDKIVNLSGDDFAGVLETTKYDVSASDVVFREAKGFREDLLADIKRIPITEDYLPVYKTLEYVTVGCGETELLQKVPDNKVSANEAELSNGIVSVKVAERISVETETGSVEISLTDFSDYGDSYNRGCVEGDCGKVLPIKSCRNIFNSPLRSVLEVRFDNVRLEISLDASCEFPCFDFEIDNTGRKNHHLFLSLHTKSNIDQTISEDMNRLIKRNFEPAYDIRKNLPTEKGREAKTNTAPCQRAVWANGVGAVLEGVTQYEVFGEELRLSLLRATGVISNPQNSTRTTPAGPPLETPDAQLSKIVRQRVFVFLGDAGKINKAIEKIYNFIYV